MASTTLTQPVNMNLEIRIWIFDPLSIDEIRNKNIKNLQSMREKRNKPPNSIDV